MHLIPPFDLVVAGKSSGLSSPSPFSSASSPSPSALKNLHVYICQAKLKHFNLIGNNTVLSKLDATIVFKKPNKWACVHYKLVHATCFYEKNMFGSVRLSKFKQGHDSIKTFDVEFEGKFALPTNWRVEEFYEAKDREGFC